MQKPTASTIIKAALLAVYLACFLGASWYLHSHGLRVRDVAILIREAIFMAGWLGPLVILVCYFGQTIIPFPTVGLAIISGTLYGPVWGTVLAMTGLIVSGSISFWIGRYFGRHFINEHEKGWIKKYDDMLKGKGFFTVLFMRLFMFPFDFASLGCGMTQMSFRQYVYGTFLGVIPSTITAVVLGQAFHRPQSWLLFGVLFSITVVVAVGLRYSPFGKKMFEPKKSDDAILMN